MSAEVNTPTGQPVLIASARDVTEAINAAPAAPGSRAIVFIALGGIFIDAYDFTALSVGLRDIGTDFQLGSLALGVVGASIMVGALLGALVGGYLVDRLGRYKLFMADMVFFVIAALGCAVSWNGESLTVFRFLMGVGIGLDFPVAMAFVAEYTARRNKAGTVSLWSPVWYVATSISFLIVLPLYYLLPVSAHSGLWRYAVGFGAVPALVILIVRHRYMDESASWAAGQGKLARAAQILRTSYGVNAAVAPGTADVVPVKAQQSLLAEMGRLFTPRYRQRTILAGVVSACQSIQYYAISFSLPFIIAGFLAQGRLESIAGSLFYNAVFGITGGIVSAKLIQRVGSWKLAFVGFGFCLAACIALGLLGQPEGGPLLAMIGIVLAVFVFFQASGPGAQGQTLAALSYPTSLRGVGAGFGQASLRVGSIISLSLFPYLSAQLGTNVFYVVALAPLLGLATLGLIRWEPTRVDVDAEDFAVVRR